MSFSDPNQKMPETTRAIIEGNSYLSFETLFRKGYADRLEQANQDRSSINAIPYKVREKYLRRKTSTRDGCWLRMKYDFFALFRAFAKITPRSLAYNDLHSEAAKEIVRRIAWIFQRLYGDGDDTELVKRDISLHDLVAMTEHVFRAFCGIECLKCQDHPDTDANSACCYDKSSKEKVVVHRFLLQVIAASIAMAKEQMSKELQNQTPKWESQWLCFTEVFGDRNVRRDYGVATQVASHAAANLVARWTVDTPPLRDRLPPELRIMIFDAVMDQGGLRDLPPPKLKVPRNCADLFQTKGPADARYIACSVCSADCPHHRYVPRSYLDWQWKMKACHVSATPRAHSTGCKCKKPIVVEQDVRKTIPELDPYGLMRSANSTVSS